MTNQATAGPGQRTTVTPQMPGNHTARRPQSVPAPRQRQVVENPPSVEEDPIFWPRQMTDATRQQANTFDLSLDVVATLRVLLAQRWLIAILTATAIVGGLVYTYFQPAQFTASVTLLPGASGDGLGGIGMGQMAGLASNFGISLGAPSVSAAYPEIVRSRQVRESILDRKFRTKEYGPVTLQDYLNPAGKTDNTRRANALQDLAKRTRIGVDKLSGVIQLTVSMHEPKLAMAVAQAFVDELMRVEEEVRLATAQYNKTFIEQRRNETNVVLSAAEDALKLFRKQNLRIGNDPELLLEAARLERGLAIQEQVFLTLTQQYELAKIEEERRGPGLQVLDPAREPLFQSGPILMKNLVMSGFLGGICACVLAVALSWWRSGRRQVTFA